jgi:hypothetical protein
MIYEFIGYTNIYGNYVAAGPAINDSPPIAFCVKQGTSPDANGSEGSIPYTFGETCSYY